MEAVQTLRDRKKAATSLALHLAAMRLAMAHGLGSVTVEAIADEANVSRRTFSNHFANKEDALLYGNRARLQQMLDELRVRPYREPAWEAVRTSAAAMYSDDDPDPQWVVQSRLVRRHPSLLGRQMAVHTEFERDLAAELQARTGDPLGARLMAAAVLAAMRIATDLWLEQHGSTPLRHFLDQALIRVGQEFR